MQEFPGIPRESSRRPARRGLIAALFLTTVVGCGDPSPVAREIVGDCAAEGGLKTELYGALETAIDWQAGQLQCQGMPRPNAAGARLRFAGTATRGEESTPLAFIFGIPALERGKTGKELPTNVTVIDEGHGRFFSTQSTDNCWSDVDSQKETATESRYIISGIVYCVAPLTELNGNNSVQLSDVHFTGLLDWKPPK